MHLIDRSRVYDLEPELAEILEAPEARHVPDDMVEELRHLDGATQKIFAERFQNRKWNSIGKISLGWNYASPVARDELRARGYSPSGRKL